MFVVFVCVEAVSFPVDTGRLKTCQSVLPSAVSRCCQAVDKEHHRALKANVGNMHRSHVWHMFLLFSTPQLDKRLSIFTPDRAIVLVQSMQILEAKSDLFFALTQSMTIHTSGCLW